MSVPFHPLANIFPLIEGEELAALVVSIKANGLRDPIIVYDGMVLDGRNRQRACEAAEVDCIYHPLPGDEDPLTFVIDKNLKRRHLNESQRAFVAAKIANMPAHRPDDKSANLQTSQAQAAALVNVSPRSVASAAKVRDKATPSVQRAVERGVLPVSVAAHIAELPAAEQERIVEAPDRAGIEIKKLARDEREVDLGKKQSALPTQKFGVIVADPEWRFEPWSRTTGMDRAADNHYPTSCTEVIAARDVPSIAADDCVLFLWATAPMLPHALLVMAAWGFDYKSHCIWDKERAGTGYWFRNMHELLLLGTKGNVPAPAPGTQWASILEALAGKHSEKPEVSLRMIEQYFPTLPKIELNRRGPPRHGWAAWGNETLPFHNPDTGELTEPVAGHPRAPATVEPASAVPLPPTRAGAGSPIPDKQETAA